MLKKVFIGFAVLVAALFIVVALQPGEFSVTRSAVIAAPPATVFGHINDLRKWQEWSPWAKLDPNATNSFSGPETGVGAKFDWVGNSEVGEGAMTITESKPNESVTFELSFRKPMEGTSQVVFSLKPEGERTEVTWAMSGENNFIGKAMGLVMDIDKMCGDQFEQGLANLNTLVAGAPAP